MGTLPDADAMAFAAHLLNCARCRPEVEAADLYVRAMREAASGLREVD
jgi:anti-sigma factor RsiW